MTVRITNLSVGP